VEANLFDEESQAPISHLNSAFLLTARENSGLLKIHASVILPFLTSVKSRVLSYFQ